MRNGLLPQTPIARNVPGIHPRIVGRLQSARFLVALLEHARAVSSRGDLAPLEGRRGRAEPHDGLAAGHEPEAQAELERLVGRREEFDGDRYRGSLAVVGGGAGGRAAPGAAGEGAPQLAELHVAVGAAVKGGGFVAAHFEFVENQLKQKVLVS